MTIIRDARGDLYISYKTPVLARGEKGRFIAYTVAMMNAARMAWEDLVRRIQQRERRLWGYRQSTWRPLNKKYKLWKVRHGYSPLKLMMTKSLYRSLTDRTNLSIIEIGKYRAGFKMKFGTKRPYAYTHQFGTDTIPRRPFLSERKTDIPYFISRYYFYLDRLTGHFGPSKKRGGGPPKIVGGPNSIRAMNAARGGPTPWVLPHFMLNMFQMLFGGLWIG